ncbi:MAG TPA: DUF4259 domain-containing protein [Gemmatimonadaceae bacterium]
MRSRTMMQWTGSPTPSRSDASVLHAAFEPVLAGLDYIEAPAANVAVAAAEVVAALRGNPYGKLPPEVIDWVRAFGRLDDERLLESARKATTIIGEDRHRSELRQLWDEAAPDDASAWRNAIADVRSRLLDPRARDS